MGLSLSGLITVCQFGVYKFICEEAVADACIGGGFFDRGAVFVVLVEHDDDEDDDDDDADADDAVEDEDEEEQVFEVDGMMEDDEAGASDAEARAATDDDDDSASDGVVVHDDGCTRRGGKKNNRSINNYEIKEMMDSQLHGMHAVVIQMGKVTVLRRFHDYRHFPISLETFCDDPIAALFLLLLPCHSQPLGLRSLTIFPKHVGLCWDSSCLGQLAVLRPHLPTVA